MATASDSWYVRLPDGRVLRAASTHVLRQHIGSGRIPYDSRVRRSPEEEWVALDWADEFTDVLRQRQEEERRAAALGGIQPRDAPTFPTGHVSARYDPRRLQTVGLSSLAIELLAALDNTLARPKLLVAGIAGTAIAIIVAVTLYFDVSLSKPLYVVPAILIFCAGLFADVLLTQMTYLELSRLRPANWSDARQGFWSFSWRLLFAYVTVGGSVAAGIFLVRWLPWQIIQHFQSPEQRVWLLVAGEAIDLILLLVEIVLWTLSAFVLLLAPIVIVEEASPLGAITQWWWLVRRHLGRLFLYQSLAVLGSMVMLVFAFPLALAAWFRWGHWGGVETTIGLGICLLAGLALAPVLAYIFVAQVFIYLNVRYEFDRASR